MIPKSRNRFLAKIMPKKSNESDSAKLDQTLADRSFGAEKSAVVDNNSFFWKMLDGGLPMPPCAKTLGIEFAAIDGERGTAEVKFEAKPEFLNPAGTVQGGFLAAMLDDTMGPALTATLHAGDVPPTEKFKHK